MQKAAPKAETVTLKDLAAKLAEAHELPKSQVNTLLTVGWRHRQAPEEGRPHPHLWPRHPAGPEAPGAHGPQPGHWRGHQNQGQQEDCVPGIQGPQGTGNVGGDAIVDMPWPRFDGAFALGSACPLLKKKRQRPLRQSPRSVITSQPATASDQLEPRCGWWRGDDSHQTTTQHVQSGVRRYSISRRLFADSDG